MAAMNFPIAVLRYTWKDYGPHTPGWLDAEFNKIFTSATWPWSIPKFWSDTTLGLLDLSSNSRVFPWKVSELDHAMVPDPKNPGQLMSTVTFDQLVTEAEKHHDDDFHIEDFSIIVVFMDPPPSDVKGSQSANAAVLDWQSPQSVMLHEVGHAMMLPHSGDFLGFDYGDPYCGMSNESGTYMFSESTVLPDPSIPPQYFLRMGPMIAAATLYENFGWFRGSPSVLEFADSARDSGELITLHALSRATLGEPVLAVIEIDGEKWTVEYRVDTGWDRGVPGWHVVVHRLHFPNVIPNQSATSLYDGSIQVPFDRGVRDWQPHGMTADLRVWVVGGDDEKVTFQFHHARDHAVSLHEERSTLHTFRSPRLRKSFPIWNGLCGSEEFYYYYESVWERMKLEAAPTAYIDPAFAWRVNGLPINPGQSVTVATTVYDDDGVTTTARPSTAQITARAQTDDATPQPIPTNELWLENDPKDGTFDLEVEVTVSDQGPRSPSSTSSSASDEFDGHKIVIPGKAEADDKCRAYWRKIGDKLPKKELNKFIDKGDPVWHILHESPKPLDPEERDRLIQLVAVARKDLASDPGISKQIAEAVAQRLQVPEHFVVPGGAKPNREEGFA